MPNPVPLRDNYSVDQLLELAHHSADNVWQYLRQTVRRNRAFQNYDNIVDRLCQARQSLLAEIGCIEAATIVTERA